MLHKNQQLTLDVTEVNNLGFGVARADNGQVVFVSGAVEGERVEAKLIHVTKSYAVARTESVLKPSPYRAEDACCVKGCGGCAYRLLTHDYEMSVKHRYVEKCLHDAGLSHIFVEPVVSGARLTGYRNKAQYPVGRDTDGKIMFGFFAPKSHRVVEASGCLLQPPIFERILSTLGCFFDAYSVSVYDEETHTGLLRHIYLRRSEKGDVLLCVVVNGEALPCEAEFVRAVREAHPEIVGILLNIQKEKTNVICGDTYRLLWGEASLTDTLAGVTLSLSPESFYQVNHEMATLLYDEARHRAKLQGNELLLDLYCGVGSIGLSMARDVREVIGIEVVEGAVTCATENARRNGIENASFYVGDAARAEDLLAHAEKERDAPIRPDVVVLDPPRKGCDRQLLLYLARLAPSRIIYISCNPKTLAEDMAVLIGEGYRADKVTPFDLFPRTAHVESVVCLTRTFDN